MSGLAWAKKPSADLPHRMSVAPETNPTCRCPNGFSPTRPLPARPAADFPGGFVASPIMHIRAPQSGTGSSNSSYRYRYFEPLQPFSAVGKIS
jgi:hypothetical protein